MSVMIVVVRTWVWPSMCPPTMNTAPTSGIARPKPTGTAMRVATRVELPETRRDRSVMPTTSPGTSGTLLRVARREVRGEDRVAVHTIRRNEPLATGADEPMGELEGLAGEDAGMGAW